MAGRNRKSGNREPNGRPQREEAGVCPAIARRIFDLARDKAVDARLGTPLGRMMVAGEISTALFDAGDRFAELRSRADAAMGFGARTVAAMDMERTQGRSVASGDPTEADMRAIRDFKEARGVLHVNELNAIEWMVCDGNPCEGHQQKMFLRRGLEVLARFFGLTAQKRAANVRNRG